MSYEKPLFHLNQKVASTLAHIRGPFEGIIIAINIQQNTPSNHTDSYRYLIAITAPVVYTTCFPRFMCKDYTLGTYINIDPDEKMNKLIMSPDAHKYNWFT